MTTRRSAIKLTGAALISGAAFALEGCDQNTSYIQTWEGEALGAPASIKIVRVNSKKGKPYGLFVSDARVKTILQDARDEIARLEKMFSLYDPSSDISRLNRDGGLDNAPQEFIDILQSARTVSEYTHGAFDITVQSLWKTAEFLTRAKLTKEGVEQAWAEAYARVDYQFVLVKNRRVEFSKLGVAITLNGIAQGFITEAVVTVLRKNGVNSALVNIGEYSGFGSRAWDIGVQDPNNMMDMVEIVKLQNASLATSSAKGGYLGEHLSHIFSPRTGHKKPQFISASVVHERAAIADALATAYTLMDEDGIGKNWRDTGAKYILLVRENGDIIRIGQPS
ncbi:MAG: FAD:protein FMN transferase [Robiginitomaculum sp.]|nr:FAD:protein FMN transferase [Robiginitomaculum sp.]